MILGDPVDDIHKLFYFFIGNGDLHPLAPQHIGGTHQHRIPQPICHLPGLLGRVNRTSGGSGNLGLFQNFVKQFSVLGGVHILRLCAQDRHAHFHQAFRELDGGLPAELHHRPVRLFQPYNTLHILRRKGFKVQLIRNIKVRAYGFRIVIDDDGLIARLCKSPGGMDGAVVELDSLSDADGA